MSNFGKITLLIITRMKSFKLTIASLTAAVVMLPLLLLGACTSSEPDMMSLRENIEIDNPNFVSVEEALKNADEQFAAMFGPRTRASRKVKDVETFRNTNATRSADDDEMFGFYIVNYENDGGFAMLSADRRREAVYAISDEGSLHLSDTLDNKGLSWYINNHMTTLDLIPTPAVPIDTLTPKPDNPKITTTMLVPQPMLQGFMAQFSQDNPFNKYCFTSDGSQAKVGCVPLAVGTVMGYYKWPQSALGYSFNWTQISQRADSDGWPRLFEILGRSSLLNVEYGTTTSNARISPVVAFIRMGYENATVNVFMPQVVNSSIMGLNPVICSGNNSSFNKYNAWVIDGGMIKEKTYESVEPAEPPVVTTYYYYRCVWGWGGTANGYYYYGNGKIGANSDLDTGLEYLGTIFQDLSIVCGFTPVR